MSLSFIMILMRGWVATWQAKGAFQSATQGTIVHARPMMLVGPHGKSNGCKASGEHAMTTLFPTIQNCSDLNFKSCQHYFALYVSDSFGNLHSSTFILKLQKVLSRPHMHGQDENRLFHWLVALAS